MDLVVVAVERRQQPDIREEGLAHEETLGGVGPSHRSPAPQHVVHLRTVGVEHLSLAADPRDGVVVVGGRRVVAELAVLDDDVTHVDAEPATPPIEPEPQDLVEHVGNGRLPPVQVRLLRKEVVEVVLPGRFVEGPRGSHEVRHPVVRRPTVGRRVGPHVPVPARRVGEPRVLIAGVVGDEVVEDADPTFVPLRPQGGRSPRGCRARGRSSSSRRRRTPSRRWESASPGSARWRPRRATPGGRGAR